MGEENQMQPAEDRANDAGRDAKRRGQAQKTDKAKGGNKKKTIISFLLIISLVLGGCGGFDMLGLGNQQAQASNTPKLIYKALGVDNLYDLIEIKGDDRSGYYYDFVEGTEEKLDYLARRLQAEGGKAITKELLKKMIKAEVVNQFPFLKGSGTATGSGGSASNYTGNTIAEKTWNFLIGQGYSEVAVAGLMGNIHQESGGFNAAIVENGGSGEGIGLCQWSYGRRDKLEAYAQAMGKDWTDVDLQLDYLLMELQGGSDYAEDGFNGSSTYRNQWENAATPEDAAIAFEYGFERASTPMMENRITWANTYYEQYRGTFNLQETDLSGVLFLGDSIIKRIDDYGLQPEDSINRAVDGLSPSDLASNWNIINILGNLPENSDAVKAICIMLGTNNPNQTTEMETLLENIHDRYPDKIIYVQKIVPNPDKQEQSENYNSEIQSYCDSKDYLIFIDTLNGVEYQSDNINPTYEGTQTLLENIKNAIINAGGVYQLGEFEGTVRIRRVTPNKNIGEVKNTGAGVITDTTSNTATSGAGLPIENYINSEATSGTWSVYAKNLTSNSIKVNVNNQKLESASLIKLFIMATAFEEIEKGTLNKSDVINDIEIMINQSDNDAANRMIDTLGFDKINNYIRTNGYSTTEIHRKMLEAPNNGDNYTSVVDVGNLLEKMYRGTCVNQNASQEMIEILKTQTLTNKIPAGVPSGVVTANKTGELDHIESDAAIVYKENAHYIVVVMSNNVNDTAAARNDIKEISSKVYNIIDTSGTSQGGTNTNAAHKVAIVAGHGVPANAGTYEQIANRTKWYTTGTSGVTPSGETMKEWIITKKVADYVEQYLYPYSSEVSVVQVGYSQPNWDRMQLAKDQGVDSYVGIHFNSSDNTSANGVSAYYRNGDASSQSFANIFTRTVSEAMGLRNDGIMDDSTSNNGQLDSIGNSSEWGFPSTLIEGGFMSNQGDMQVIGAADEEGLKKYAKGIATGILEYYNIDNTGLEGISITNSTTTTTSGVNSKIYDLKYVSPEKFEQYIESNSRQALNTYTLDKETKKLIVANWSYTTEEGLKIIKSEPINFRSVLNKYTMPIEYMIDFLVHTDDEQMVGKLADLAIDTEYIIAVQDNVTTVQTTVDLQAKDYRRTRIDDDEYVITLIADWHTTSKTITVRETVSNEIELTYADSWFVKFSKTSSYANMNVNSSLSNNFTADQGEYLGDFLITTYCYACNDDGAGNFGTTATASGRDATENLSIAVNPSMFNNAGSGLHNGDYVIINGNVYRVDDVGPSWRPQQWADIYIATNGGACVCDYSSLNSNATPVYVASNVREVSSENTEDNENIEGNNKQLKGINTITNVTGEVKDTTTVMEEMLEPIYTPTARNREIDVTERKKITTVRTISNRYDSGKEDKESNEQKFIDVFLSSNGILNRFNMGWMESLLAQDEKTVNMIDLTKYLYNKAKDYDSNIQNDNEKYNFDVYEHNDLYNIYGSSGILEEFIKSLENNPLRLYMNNHTSIDEGEVNDYIITNRDESLYRMITNGYNGRGFGFNIFHRLNATDWNTGKPVENRIVEHYEDLGFDITPYVNMDMTIETDTVDQVMRKEIQKWRDIVEESIKNRGIDLEDYQIDALTVIAYEYGWSEQDTESFLEAYATYYLTNLKGLFREKCYIAQKTVRPFYIMSDVTDKTEQEEKQQLRASLIWNLFDKGEYKTPEGEVLDPDSFNGGMNGEILSVAYECWKKVCEANPVYSQAGCVIPWQANSGHIDCSTYVSWVLYEYGISSGNDDLANEFRGGQHSTETLKTVDWDKLGFEVIPVVAGQNVTDILQPGDILDRTRGDGSGGHVQIIVEVNNGTIYTYDCGATNHWSGRNGEPYVSNFAADSRPGIIIRKK